MNQVVAPSDAELALEFLTSLKELTGIVSQKSIISDQDAAVEPRDFSQRVVKGLKELRALENDGADESDESQLNAEPKSMYEIFVQSAERLLSKDHKAFVSACLGCDISETQGVDRGRIELLTTCWLALNFLGIPYFKPWEIVLCWAEDESGGLPNGVCVAKAIGDIVRSARKNIATKRLVKDTPALIVLSGLPLLLFKLLVRHDGEPDNLNRPDDADMLGRCYELLQLHLYLKSGGSILYCIRGDVVAEGFRVVSASRKAPLTRAEAHDIWRESLKWLRSHLAEDAAQHQNQEVYIVDEPAVPACFINDEIGMYTFERLGASAERAKKNIRDKDMPLPASYMKDIRRVLYIEKLVAESKTMKSRNLLTADLTILDPVFDTIFAKYEKLI
ncbi:hypothetical protein AWB79_00720 [Caballeronia hypogeia]|uniref:Uncharacterized protein n=1 Tax=Caballeronia hypogeia TaxID=1777140 RepID=A0A157ZDY8_9BURK|nr:hypothetical protein [Caballeronia hypogeia]SAK43746.1 hypothetical protein AWB79_00720 [Caballeronia hypogeia]